VSDLVAFHYDTDEEAISKGLIIAKSIDWQCLPVDDLEALSDLFSDLAEKGGFEGCADVVPTEEGEHEAEGGLSLV
jgi:hypothetical protein